MPLKYTAEMLLLLQRKWETKKPSFFSLLIIFGIISLFGCRNKKHETTKTTKEIPTQFEVLESTQTGLSFANILTPSADFNMFNYMYFYNGAGVGAGDFNNDGFIDLFFASNQAQNKLFLNKGNFQFKDATVEAAIPIDSGWSTGVSVVDINNDGLLDIYVCRVGNFEVLHARNQLLVCKGIDSSGTPRYEDEAKDYGLDFSGFSTQAAFFDYDMDGDCDMYLMNHSVRNNGTFGMRSSFVGTYDSLAGDRLYRNDGNHFTDVTKQSGINSSAIGYGLGICVADLNLDGWPDLYIGNDFHENDYLYINQKNGTFKDDISNCIMHTSQFSMGVDAADINNDGYPDIISMDMLPSDPYILKRSLGEDEYNLFNMKINYGYMPQYARNNLQLHEKNGCYTEIGRYANVFATDWSWSALWMDFDNDGYKDLFVSNGIPKRLNDMDYVNFISNDEMQSKIRNKALDKNDMSLIDKFPEIKLPNKFYRNTAKAAFEDIAAGIKNDRPTFSNGAVYADLDNDGDLDIVVNNIADSALIYRNTANDSSKQNYLQINLKGPRNNLHAIGAKVIVFADSSIETYEKFPARGFMSSMEIPVHIGLNKIVPDSIKLIWPDNSWEFIKPKNNEHQLAVAYSKGHPKFEYTELTNRFKNNDRLAVDITTKSNLLYKHQENNFVEFDREPLMPHMASQEGPALAVGDLDGDGLTDIYVGAARGFKSAIFLRRPDSKEGITFLKTIQPSLDLDSNYEDVSACIADVNNDGFNDIIVASGGNEYFAQDRWNIPRVYLNNGKAEFSVEPNAFDSLYTTASCVVPYDFNNDGFTDLFIGGRSVSFAYGKKPASFLLQNDGKGHFKNVTASYAPGLEDCGFVTNATWYDLDKDGLKDLVLSTEWDGIYGFMNKGKNLAKKQLVANKGWWNFVMPFDADGDGDIDILAGNLGLNSRLRASVQEPVTLYYYDFDGNGKKEQIFTYYLNHKEIPFANKGELEKQLPALKKRFLYAEDFAKAPLTGMFTKAKLDSADRLTADYFENAILINDGKMNFTVKALPWQAQLSCYKDAALIDVNNDNLPDVFMAGNFYANNIQMGRYDGDYGLVLVNKGNGNFSCEQLNGVTVKGQARHVIAMPDIDALLVAKNNDSLRLIQFEKKRPGK